MKYIRTKDGAILKGSNYGFGVGAPYKNYDVRIADTIEELCDERVLSHYFEETDYTDYKVLPKSQWELMARSVSARLKYGITDINYLGAIWTDKGLIYVAKLNEKGGWELL